MENEVRAEFLDSSIADELVRLVHLTEDSTLLVRGWDSGRDPVSISRSLSMFGISSRILAEGAEVGLAADVTPSLAHGLFGFDEVWIGSRSTVWTPLLQLGPMTSDSVDFRKDDLSAFMDAFRVSGARMALGDGCGLNILRTA